MIALTNNAQSLGCVSLVVSTNAIDWLLKVLHPRKTDIRLMASFPGQPVSQHQKGKTILDCNEARDDGVAVASAGPYANHLHLTPDR